MDQARRIRRARRLAPLILVGALVLFCAAPLLALVLALLGGK